MLSNTIVSITGMSQSLERGAENPVMFATFLATVGIVLIVSFSCSLTEAALYAVSPSYVRHLSERGTVAGKLLRKFKSNIDRPIVAILILNTFANTAGAAIAGAQASLLWGEEFLVWFTLGITLAVLYLGEITPKVLGVTHSRSLAPIVSVPLEAAMLGLTPLIWLSQKLTQFLRGSGKGGPVAPEEEVLQMARLSAEEGSILPIEAHIIHNVLRLNEVKVRDVMTPRTVLTRLPAELTLKELAEQDRSWRHSRIPVYSGDDMDNLTGVVLRRDIYTHLADDNFEPTVGSLAKPIRFVPEHMPGHMLLNEFLTARQHLFGVVDEYGGLAGIVTLEDILESLLGREIVGEFDPAVDMQELARRLARARASRRT
jgi:CBS domain containing-hemolysin-like protein